MILALLCADIVHLVLLCSKIVLFLLCSAIYLAKRKWDLALVCSEISFLALRYSEIYIWHACTQRYFWPRRAQRCIWFATVLSDIFGQEEMRFDPSVLRNIFFGLAVLRDIYLTCLYSKICLTSACSEMHLVCYCAQRYCLAKRKWDLTLVCSEISFLALRYSDIYIWHACTQRYFWPRRAQRCFWLLCSEKFLALLCSEEVLALLCFEKVFVLLLSDIPRYTECVIRCWRVHRTHIRHRLAVSSLFQAMDIRWQIRQTLSGKQLLPQRKVPGL